MKGLCHIQQHSIKLNHVAPVSDLSPITAEISQSIASPEHQKPSAKFVDRMVGEAGLYETPSEYVRDLIRRDMELRDGQFMQEAILAGYRDLAAGRVFASSGDFKADMAVLDGKEA